MPHPLNAPPCFASRSPIGDILDMIERCAPVLMRCGGGNGNGINTPNGGRPVTPEMKQRFEDGLRAGKTMAEVAEDEGVHYGTVVKHTRHVRAQRKTA